MSTKVKPLIARRTYLVKREGPYNRRLAFVVELLGEGEALSAKCWLKDAWGWTTGEIVVLPAYDLETGI